MMAEFSAVYFVLNEEFILKKANTEYKFKAYSGGARTSKNNLAGKKRNDESWGSYSPKRVTEGANTITKIAKQAGGPIPPGEWEIVSFTFNQMTQGALLLKPSKEVKETTFNMRDFKDLPFLIHATGPAGSWGCITMQTKDLHQLFILLGLKDYVDTNNNLLKNLKPSGPDKLKFITELEANTIAMNDLEAKKMPVTFKFKEAIKLQVIFDANIHYKDWEPVIDLMESYRDAGL